MAKRGWAEIKKYNSSAEVEQLKERFTDFGSPWRGIGIKALRNNFTISPLLDAGKSAFLKISPSKLITEAKTVTHQKGPMTLAKRATASTEGLKYTPKDLVQPNALELARATPLPKGHTMQLKRGANIVNYSNKPSNATLDNWKRRKMHCNARNDSSKTAHLFGG